MPWIPHNDAFAQAVFKCFKEALDPALEAAAPDWLLHHMMMERRSEFETGEEVRIVLVLRPLGIARVVDVADVPIQEHRASRPLALPGERECPKARPSP